MSGLRWVSPVVAVMLASGAAGAAEPPPATTPAKSEPAAEADAQRAALAGSLGGVFRELKLDARQRERFVTAVAEYLADKAAGRAPDPAAFAATIQALGLSPQQQDGLRDLIMRWNASRIRRAAPSQPAEARLIEGVKLTPEQRRKLEAILRKYDADVAALQADKGAGQADRGALQEQRRRIAAERDAAIAALLTPEQKAARARALLMKDAMAVFRHAKANPPTRRQRDEVAALCDRAARRIAELKDGKGAEGVRAELARSVRSLLTDAQKAEFEAAEAKRRR